MDGANNNVAVVQASSGIPPVASATGSNAKSTSPQAQLAHQLIPGRAGDGDITAPAEASNGGLLNSLTSNPFFAGGFALGALGLAATAGRRALGRAGALLRRRLLVDLEITRKDESYLPFLQWMSAYSRSQLTQSVPPPDATLLTRLMTRFTPGIHHLSMVTSREALPNGTSHTRFSMVPGPGHHILRYNNAFISVRRERDEKAFDMSSGSPFETIKLTTLYAHRFILPQLFQEAHALAARAEEGKTTIYMPDSISWKPFGYPKRKRPLESVVLSAGVKEHILSDVRGFIANRTWYLDRGIPYRRGYLLYGPPGTGKSSFIEALAGELDFDIAMLTLSQRGLTDDRLNVLLTNVPSRTLVLLEDADAAFANRRQSSSDGYTGATVTFSGLLNALDGVASAEERIVFLTTNHIDRMDEALIRPGRVDMAIRLGEATQEQALALWERFYAEQDVDGVLGKEFVAKLDKLGLLGRVSTAALQGVFLFHKDDPPGAVDSLEQLKVHLGAPSGSPVVAAENTPSSTAGRESLQEKPEARSGRA